jgi:hypothetical protein
MPFRPRNRLVPLLLILIAWSLILLWRSTDHRHAHFWTIHDDAGVSAFESSLSDTSLFDALALAETWTNRTDRYLPSARAMKLANDFVECRGKERLVDILLEASSLSFQEREEGHDELFATKQSIQETCRSLPTFQQISGIYGNGPVVVGLETCHAYRDFMTSDPRNRLMDPMPRVAGLYHSGTNALSKTLELNLGFIHSNSQWSPYEVPVCACIWMNRRRV